MSYIGSTKVVLVKTIEMTVDVDAVVDWVTGCKRKPPKREDVTLKSGVNTAYLVYKALSQCDGGTSFLEKCVAAGLDGAR